MRTDRYRLALPFALACLALVGCGTVSRIVADARMDIGEVSLADRCADIMQRAFPGGGIEVTRQTATANMGAATAMVGGVRGAVKPGGSELRDVAVECRFDHGILTGFRWTQGPVR